MRKFLSNSLLGIVGVILAIAGGLLISLSPDRNDYVAKGASETYTTNWQASKLYWQPISVRYATVGTALGSADINIPAFGVSQWKVTGQSSTSLSWSETWQGPAPSTLNMFEIVRTSGGAGGALRCNPNLSSAETRKMWLAGCVVQNGGSATPLSAGTMGVGLWGLPAGKFVRETKMEEIDVTAYDQSKLRTVPSNPAAGTVGSCTNDNGSTECFWTTGSYGFSYGNNTEPKMSFVAIPLQWTVTGTISSP